MNPKRMGSKSHLKYNKPMAVDQNLEKITSLIRGIVEPEKVVLFGSRATGRYADDSDYDICIVLKEDQGQKDVIKKINRAIYRSDISKPVDVIAIDSEKFRRHAQTIGYIYKDISQNGITIYGE